MYALRRSAALAVRLNTRGGWRQLARFVDPSTQQGWNDLRQRDTSVKGIIEDSASDSQKDIDWKYWQSNISHQNLVQCLKAYYDNQKRILDSMRGNVKAICPDLHTHGWKLFDDAVKECTLQVQRSQELLSSGSQALWISYHNPPLPNIDTNEWLDSDLYSQAFVDKHFGYSPYQPGIENPESEAQKDAVASSWHLRMGKFNDRSDTPMLYVNMEQLPSWEYYDIHRRAFLEHMIYFLVRKGTDYRQFPEVPPWQWLGDIEDHRFKFLSVAQHRRAHAQLENLERERPLDFMPTDVVHDGEEYTLKFLKSEAEWTQFCVTRLMGNYMFLCDPFIPAQTYTAALKAMEIDNGKGKWYTLGSDVNALFYLPQNHTTMQTENPTAGFYKLMDHLTMSGRRLNPSYATLCESFAEILEMRGNNWFNITGECQSQAFLRRLRSDDPHREVYISYFTEMYTRFMQDAKELSKDEFTKRMQSIENQHKEECNAYELFLQINSTTTQAKTKESVEWIKKEYESGQLTPLIESQKLQVVGFEGHNEAQQAEKIIESISAFDKEKDLFSELSKSQKV